MNPYDSKENPDDRGSAQVGPYRQSERGRPGAPGHQDRPNKPPGQNDKVRRSDLAGDQDVTPASQSPETTSDQVSEMENEGGRPP